MSSTIIQTGFSANFTLAWCENAMAQTLENTLETNN
jgi:hypothetical protein